MGLPNLDKLVAKCEQLGLSIETNGKKLGKAHCVAALRKHFMPEGGLPYTEVEPMLAFASWNLKEEELARCWSSTGWGAQEKFNGCRLVMHFAAGVGVFAHSRTVSVKTFRFEEATDRLLIHGMVPNFSATIDVEAMIAKPVDTRGYTTGSAEKGTVTKSSLHSATAVMHLKGDQARKLQIDQDAAMKFRVFDVMSFQGKDLKRLPLKTRETYRLGALKEAIQGFERAADFDFPAIVTQGKKEYCQKIWSEGGEGVILKNLEAPYVDSSSRDRNAWVKVKKRMEVDAFVIGFLRGEADGDWVNLVGSIEFGVYLPDGKIHSIGFATNLTMEQRLKISTYDPATNTVGMVPGMYGKVAEISGQDISARSFRLSHCTVDRWRPKQGPDAKFKEDCTMSMEDLQAAAEWVS